jgi:hypothetical protein
MAVVAVITNYPRRRTTRMTSPSPEDVIRWPKSCMHRGINMVGDDDSYNESRGGVTSALEVDSDQNV